MSLKSIESVANPALSVRPAVEKPCSVVSSVVAGRRVSGLVFACLSSGTVAEESVDWCGARVVAAASVVVPTSVTEVSSSDAVVATSVASVFGSVAAESDVVVSAVTIVVGLVL